jgi:hypothetical protein
MSAIKWIGSPRLRFFWLTLVALAVLSLPSCSINVKKEPNGRDKQVDIKTLFGGVHVSKGADIADVGVALYPGAHPKETDDDKSANVNISGFGYGVKVVALQYESNDPPAKLVSFYRDELKKLGNVLECRNTGHFDVNMKMPKRGESHELSCDSTHGDNVELKVGTKENQHIVAVEPDGKGSTFSLVYVHVHDKDAQI